MGTTGGHQICIEYKRMKNIGGESSVVKELEMVRAKKFQAEDLLKLKILFS